MKEWTIAVLPGDGIGPEVTAEAARALEAVAERFGLGLVMSWYAVGAAGGGAGGGPPPPGTRAPPARAAPRPPRARGGPAVGPPAPPPPPEDRLVALRARVPRH